MGVGVDNSIIFLIVGNFINLFGVSLLLYGQYNISIRADDKNGFVFIAIGSFAVSLGSIFLKSWPVAFLHFSISIFSLIGYFKRKDVYRSIPKIENISFYMFFVVMFAIFSLSIGFISLSAWLAVFVFLFAFSMFSLERITHFEYLLWLFISIIISLFHLVYVKSYIVYFYEFVGLFIIGLGLVKYINQFNEIVKSREKYDIRVKQKIRNKKDTKIGYEMEDV